MLLLRPEKDSPKAFRSEILDLLWKAVLDEDGPTTTPTHLVRAYLCEREAAELDTPCIPERDTHGKAVGPCVCDYVQALYVVERKGLAPARGFDDEHYEATFTLPEQVPEADVPVSFLRDLAKVLAHRDHVQDEAMYAYFAAHKDDAVEAL
jgi:hypothetical protein